MIQPRSAVYPDRPAFLGAFLRVRGTRYECVRSGAVFTHSDNSEKNTLTLTWIAPPGPAGHVVFRVTFVQSFTNYWVGINSPVVYDGVSRDLTMMQAYSLQSATDQSCLPTRPPATTTIRPTTTTIRPTTTTIIRATTARFLPTPRAPSATTARFIPTPRAPVFIAGTTTTSPARRPPATEAPWPAEFGITDSFLDGFYSAIASTTTRRQQLTSTSTTTQRHTTTMRPTTSTQPPQTTTLYPTTTLSTTTTTTQRPTTSTTTTLPTPAPTTQLQATSTERLPPVVPTDYDFGGLDPAIDLYTTTESAGVIMDTTTFRPTTKAPTTTTTTTTRPTTTTTQRPTTTIAPTTTTRATTTRETIFIYFFQIF
ncbi:salivary glue protein Sgs-3-like [Dreissena polymorpha]|nr:salivary glue protein Sgs-3-like [Dreissena polymorpha]